jgi:UDP-3-O-[3-hydroxymyristoyl] glucosamine N-acyltransferase
MAQRIFFEQPPSSTLADIAALTKARFVDASRSGRPVRGLASLYCRLTAQIGLAGSLTIGDNVAPGAKVGINNHVRIGDGARVSAMSGVKDHIPANGRWGGFFAKPTKQWFREIVAPERLVRHGTTDPKGEGRE